MRQVDKMQLAKGDIVTVREADYFVTAVYEDTRWIEVGTELIVTSKMNGYAQVRPLGNRERVVRIPYERLWYPDRLLGERPVNGADPEDPALAWIFEDAARLADRLGLCADYDRITEQLGLPGRLRTWVITFKADDGVTLTAKVEARSRRQAEDRLRGMQRVPEMVSARAITG
jgi:hypothetical protein